MRFDFKFAPISFAAIIALAAPAYTQEAVERLGAPAPVASAGAAAPASVVQLAPVGEREAGSGLGAPQSAAAPAPVGSAPAPDQIVPPAEAVATAAPAASAPTNVTEAASEQPAPGDPREAALPPQTSEPAAASDPAPVVVEQASPAPAPETRSVETAAPAATETPAAPASAQNADNAPVVAPDSASQSTASAEPAGPSLIQIALRAAVEQMTSAPVSRHAPGQTPSAALRHERAEIAAFYKSRDFTPVWIERDSFNAAARAAVARIERAREDGLDLTQYAPPTLDASTPEAMALADLALSQAVVGYARQASGVRVAPRSIGLITARPEIAAPQDALIRVSAAADAGEELDSFNPPHEGYRALREKLIELRRERPAVAMPRIGPGRVLKVGMKDPRVPLVRARFGINASADNPGQELVYDTRVASAVADFQRAHGLPANGALTGRTIALLSGGDPERLEREILASMEMWRWAPRDMGDTRIEVNIVDFRARLIRSGRIAHSMRVIVGKPQTPTPVFSDVMSFMVVNPSWHVPQSIIRKQLAQDPTYYARNGYEVVRRGNNVFVRQPPGERNALGFVKFMFPNEHAVYMHDTPSRRLFGASRRAFSHGCVRVDQPFAFAEKLVEETGWSEKRLRSIIGKGERTIRFSQGVPVHIMYLTAFIDDDGKFQLRDDLYGHSRKLQASLGI